jgi:Icc-related predicted phosphoesterase
MNRLLIVAALGVVAAALRGSELTVAHLCDPQLGFGGFSADSARFEQEISQVNELSPDVVVIAGDMVNQITNELQVAAVLKLIAKIKPPVILTPGNHDLPDPVTVEGLARYRSVFGADFSTMECKGRLIVSANSQLWRQAPQEERDQQEQKLRNALQQAKEKGQPVIMLTHVPPFLKSVEEKDEYFNLPSALRRDVLRLCEDSGVLIWLAGHTHKTAQRTSGKITILNGETTSRNFDKHPFGFRLLTLHADSHFDWEFIPLKQK